MHTCIYIIVASLVKRSVVYDYIIIYVILTAIHCILHFDNLAYVVLVYLYYLIDITAYIKLTNK